MSILDITVQAGVSLAVVALYHWWATRARQPSPAPVAEIPIVVTPVVTPEKVSPVAEAMPPEVLAVIAAAITVVLGGPHRVVSVQQASGRTPEVNVWALEGRVEQFMSHRVR